MEVLKTTEISQKMHKYIPLTTKNVDWIALYGSVDIMSKKWALSTPQLSVNSTSSKIIVVLYSE